jgi:hypothetical protein
MNDGLPEVDEQTAKAFKAVFDYAVADTYRATTPGSPPHRGYAVPPFEEIGRKLIALAWVTSPSFFVDSPSLVQLAKQFHTTPRILTVLTAEASRRFGITNRSQAHYWQRVFSKNGALKPSAPEEKQPNATI